MLISELWNTESITIANILTDNIFKYQIILINKIVLFISFTFYFFNLSTNSQYNDSKFKKLLIYLDCST